jgi:hypothetical protein
MCIRETFIMICPKCGLEQPDGNTECTRCGVIFARIHAVMQRPAGVPAPGGSDTAKTGSRLNELFLRTGDLALNVAPDENRLAVAGRAIVYVVLVVWGLRLMTSTIQSNQVGESFMHWINIPFHEAGHVLFSPFGRFLHVLGGTLGQLLIPFVVLCSFLIKRDHFGASVGLWWLGENFLDIAPYVDDARAGQLILLGGVTGSEVKGYHDWEVILTSLGWLRYDHLIARFSIGIGIIIMVLSFIWGGYILRRQLKGSV